MRLYIQGTLEIGYIDDNGNHIKSKYIAFAPGSQPGERAIYNLRNDDDTEFHIIATGGGDMVNVDWDAGEPKPEWSPIAPA